MGSYQGGGYDTSSILMQVWVPTVNSETLKTAYKKAGITIDPYVMLGAGYMSGGRIAARGTAEGRWSLWPVADTCSTESRASAWVARGRACLVSMPGSLSSVPGSIRRSSSTAARGTDDACGWAVSGETCVPRPLPLSGAALGGTWASTQATMSPMTFSASGSCARSWRWPS